MNLVNTKQTVAVRLAQATGAVTGDPEVVRQDKHGHAWALAAVSPDGNIWGATVNRTAGDAEKGWTTSSSHCSRRAVDSALQRRRDIAPT